MRQIFIFLLTLGFLSSCSVDVEPKGLLSSEVFWENEDDVNRALMGCYAAIDIDVYNSAYQDGYTDIVYAQYPWESNATIIAAGSFDDNMNDGYNFIAIRRYNYFLDNIDRVSLPEAKSLQYKAEVRVLRALRYFNMASKFGAVPLFRVSVNQREEAIVEPTSEQEVIDFVISELQESIPHLPDMPQVKSRIGKATAYAIKARVHLFYKQWSQAAAASKKIMDMNRYHLFQVTSLTEEDKKDDYSHLISFNSDEEKKEKFLKGLRSYEKLFWEENKENDEVIFNQEFIEGTYNWIGRYFLPTNYYGGWASITPTQELVDKYGKQDGTLFTPPSTEQRRDNYEKGVKEGNWDDYLEEFKDRDTRLYASVLFPQSPWFALMKGEKFEWRDKGNGSNLSKTGYNFRKMVDPSDPVFIKRGIQDFPVIRYAEVLLTFAEAQNEVSGPNSEVYDAIDKIRMRAGMPRVSRADYSSQEQMRELIRRERCVELAGEGFRWNDIRRWELSSQVMKNTYSISGGLAQKRKWEPRFVRLPYPQSAIDVNPKLIQAQKAKGY